MSTFHFKVLTPKSTALDARVTSIVVPGETGYMGALSDHAPIISTLAPGRMKVTFEDKSEKWYAIGGGILKIKRNEAVVLTESFEEENQPA